MRVMVFFDLPVLTAKNRRDYTHFRKYLLKNGFMMEQESVYSKLVPNSTAADSVIENVRKNRTEDGVIEILKVTEKQYNSIQYITGERNNSVLDTDERIVFL